MEFKADRILNEIISDTTRYGEIQKGVTGPYEATANVSRGDIFFIIKVEVTDYRADDTQGATFKIIQHGSVIYQTELPTINRNLDLPFIYGASATIDRLL